MSTNKSFSTETSERYSRALFEVAQESSELEKIENDIKNFASLLINSLEIKNFIHNPTQSKDNQNNALNLINNLDLNFFLILSKGESTGPMISKPLILLRRVLISLAPSILKD